MANKKRKWQLRGHSHQIADSGDTDDRYEITDGNISFFTKEDEDEGLEEIVAALNNYGDDFFADDSVAFELGLVKKEKQELRTMLNESTLLMGILFKALMEGDDKISYKETFLQTAALTAKIEKYNREH